MLGTMGVDYQVSSTIQSLSTIMDFILFFEYKFHARKRCCLHVMFSTGNLIACMCASTG